MNFSLIDAGGLALSVVSYGPLVILPGAALARLLDPFEFRRASDARKAALALVVGIATLPAIDSVVTRLAGLDCALGLNLMLAAIAVVIAVRTRWRPPLAVWPLALLAIWFAVLMFEWIDFDIAGKLYHPYTAFDMVKHAATAQAIHDTGAPPQDPFFLRPERVSYYYFFYTLAALSERLGGGFFDARAAVGGLAFWIGAGLFGITRLLLERGGFLTGGTARRSGFLILATMAASGLDVLFVLWHGLTTGFWLADPAWWNEQITGWFESTLWVPHHLAALIALFVGFMASVDGLAPNPSRPTGQAPDQAIGLNPPTSHRERLFLFSGHALGPIILAGISFASALGLSVWVTFAGATTACIWCAILAVERRWRAVAVLAAIGIVALLVAAPQIADLRAGRDGGLPIGFTIRAFTLVDEAIPPGPLRFLARFLSLPLNYGAEFGVLALGALLYWRDRRLVEAAPNELARLVAIAALTGLGLGTFLESLILNNDLGWRVMLLPSLAGLVWTVAALDRRWPAHGATPLLRGPILSLRGLPLAAVVLLGIGYATTLYAFVGLRAYYAFSAALPRSARAFAAHPDTEHALRTAYGWANDHLPPGAVLQHNPMSPDNRRALGFGLYSHNPVAVGDAFGGLFGADFERVFARIDDLGPIFTQAMPDADVRARARANGIDDLVVTADDGVWADHASWAWRAKPLYESARVRIVPVSALERRPLAWTHPSDKPSLSFQRYRASDRTQKSATFASDALAQDQVGSLSSGSLPSGRLPSGRLR